MTSTTEILVVSDFHPSESLGGGPAIAFDFYEELRRIGIESEFYFFREIERESVQQTRLKQIFKRSNCPRPHFRLFKVLKNTFTFLRDVKRVDPKVVWIHSIGNRIPIFSLYFLWLLKYKFFVTLHDFNAISPYKIKALRTKGVVVPIIPSNLKYKLFQKLNIIALSRAIFCATLSKYQLSIFRSVGLKNICLIPNGIPICEHEVKDRDLKDPELKILFAGRSRNKGLMELRQAIEMESQLPVHLYLAGNSDLQSNFRVSGLNVKISYLGLLSRNQVHEKIHEVDVVYVCSQYFDPYPTIGLEGIRHGALVITSECTGLVDLLQGKDYSNLITGLGELPNLKKLKELCSQRNQNIGDLSRLIPTLVEVTDSYLEKLRKN